MSTSCSTRSAPGSCAGCYPAELFWFLGFPDRALERIEAGLALGQRLAHASSVAFALGFAALVHNLRREFAAARTRAEAAIAFAGEHRMPQWHAEATMFRGFALVGLGQQAELGERGAAGEQSSHGVQVRLGAASDQAADLPGQNRRHARDGGGRIAEPADWLLGVAVVQVNQLAEGHRVERGVGSSCAPLVNSRLNYASKPFRDRKWISAPPHWA